MGQKKTSNNGSLLLVAPEGHRVYLDSEFKGLTSDEEDGIYIEKIPVGKYNLDLKKGSEIVFTTKAIINEGELSEYNYEAKKDKNDIRISGYYKAGMDNTLTKNRLFGTKQVKVHGQRIYVFKKNGRFIYMKDFFNQHRGKEDIREFLLSKSPPDHSYYYDGDMYEAATLSFFGGDYTVKENRLIVEFDEGSITEFILSANGARIEGGEVVYNWFGR